MIVSIHIPKTAGTSFGLCLAKHFSNSIQFDYDRDLFQEDQVLDRKRGAMQRALELRAESFKGVACVHGHFLGMKYSLLAERMPCALVTWVRHPVERLLSHYYFWVETYDPRNSAGLFRRVIEEKWSFERFCMHEDFRNFQSQFLWGLPLSTFEFVGITEHYAGDFERFSRRYLGRPVEEQHVNSTHVKPRIGSLDSGLRKAIEEYHSVDMALYEAALARRGREMAGVTADRAAVRAASAVEALTYPTA